jgi:hypothetical protein
VRQPQHGVGDVDTLRHVGAHDHELRIGDVAAMHARQVVQVVVHADAAVGRPDQVAVLRIPGRVALEEQHLVAARRKGAHQRAVCRGVTVAPR